MGVSDSISGNDLLAISEEPNVRIMETKGLLCNVRAGRRKGGKRDLTEMKKAMNQPA